MAKKPKNDNLVMESIEDLFNQADSISETEKNRVKREQAKSLPIIGAQPVRIENSAPITADPLVLAGQKRPLSEKTETLFSLEPPAIGAEMSGPQTLNNEGSGAAGLESENPFLAIRQAVISAGEPTQPNAHLETDSAETNASKITATGEKSGAQEKLKGQNFTTQIAQLIDNEIEIRLKAQLSIIALANHPEAEQVRKKRTAVRKSKKLSAKIAQKSPTTKKTAAEKQKKQETRAKPVAKTETKKALAPKQLPAKTTSRKKRSTSGAPGPKKNHDREEIS